MAAPLPVPAITEVDSGPRAQPVPLPTGIGASLSRGLALLRRLRERYEETVVKNPELISKIESVLKMASYLVPGRVGGHWGVSELAYCLSNLYTLLNDYIVTSKCPAANTMGKHTRWQSALMWLLTVVECVEVGVEVTVEQMLGEPAKWGTVISLHLFKAVLRTVLVFRLSAGVLMTPAVPSPDRRKAQALFSHSLSLDGQPLAWQAPRTAKIVRSVQTDSSSVPYSELQHHLAPATPLSSLATSVPGRLGLRQMLAEALYITRPLVHLLTMFGCSQTSWRPWLLSLAMDLVSLQLHGGLLQLKPPVKAEILRRRAVLLLYLLRSPFYDAYTKNVLFSILSFLAASVPLLHWILDPVISYIPMWQQIYSYSWMT